MLVVCQISYLYHKFEKDKLILVARVSGKKKETKLRKQKKRKPKKKEKKKKRKNQVENRNVSFR